MLGDSDNDDDGGGVSDDDDGGGGGGDNDDDDDYGSGIGDQAAVKFYHTTAKYSSSSQMWTISQTVGSSHSSTFTRK